MTLKELVDVLNANKDDKVVFVGKLPAKSVVAKADKTDAAVVLKLVKSDKVQTAEDAAKLLVVEGGDALTVTVDGVGAVASAVNQEGKVLIKVS